MTSTLKNLLSPLNNIGKAHRAIQWYIASLVLPTQRRSLANASQMSGLHISQFSRLLSEHSKLAATALQNIAKKTLKRLQNQPSAVESTPLDQLPWKAYLIIDSTPQRRSSSRAKNVKRFNLGGGYWFGHRWTNVVIYFKSRTIPLEPIPFYSEDECNRRNISYKTEPELVVDYLKNLNIRDYLPKIVANEVVVLMDAGYDVKTVQKVILDRGWDFISALHCDRKVGIVHHDSTRFGEEVSWMQVQDIMHRFKQRTRISTCRLKKLPGQKRRKIFHTKRIEGMLNGTCDRGITLLSSKKPGDKKEKFLACSRVGLPTWMIVQGYSIRFMIENYHKDVKQYLGFEEMATHDFDSVISHVNWVYCAYLLLHEYYPDHTGGTREKQKLLDLENSEGKLKKMIQISTQIDGAKKVASFCRSQISNSKRKAA